MHGVPPQSQDIQAKRNMHKKALLKMLAIFCPKSSKILDGFVEFLGQKVPLTFKVNFLMYNPLSLDTLRLGRDPMQSLSAFYQVVKKIFHFQHQKN